MLNESAAVCRSVTWDELNQADYQFATPFKLMLPEGEVVVDQVARLIPGRRMVVFGVFRGVPVVAKLFYDRTHAARHAAKDSAGVEVLVQHKIPTPALLHQSVTADNKIHALIFERILNGQDLEKIWRNRESIEDVLSVLEAVMIELATQHVLGVEQKDMHMGNFLIAGKTIYTLDGADVIAHGELLQKEDSMKNLSLFLSQLGSGVEMLQEHLFLYYAKARGWLLKPHDTADLNLQIKKWNESRWKSFEKKIFRNSTDFIAVKRMTMQGMMRRDHAGPELNAFMQNPEELFTRPDVVMLKNGRSATVIKVMLDNRELVIKRYNVKNMWHRMRRMFRITRARKSWRLAQKLNLFYVNTALPVGFIEINIFGFRGKSYYVTENIGGSHVRNFLQAAQQNSDATVYVIQRTAALFRSLARLEMSHGDLKASNIIINADLQPVLIDLDGALEHMSSLSLRKAWRDELQRFMQNFEDLPAFSELIRQALQEAQQR
ncbi:MAG TPA: lipopolysaccharide kinase InaA family protein [Gammaproteobacteria bacterium]|jgi:tRNA A-37 threonylcarbamoyl transferase component Bud32|nr:lipopolysaccharide kinase InaA family protein [Gammaproteobacteria bacterium]